MVGRISGIAAGLVLGLTVLGFAGPVAAEPTQVLEIRGKKLIVYTEATGAPLKKRILAADVDVPLQITGISPNGRYQVEINGVLRWIPKAQTVTDEKVAAPAVSCQSISKSYASSRGFSDCTE